MVVGLKEYEQDASEEEKELIDSSNAALKFAVENYWNFNKIEGIMPLSEAKKYASENKNTHCYMTIDL
ncbi:hypothetical protein JYT51_01160, partial [Candidatus Amoebophilus asiaticus]|nr:hypothetical protein [Candidatus Amoebophilus asiaticus]